MNKIAEGFTLVELIAALSIAVLIAVTVMGLSGRMAQAAKQVREKHPIESWHDVIEAKLRRDYQNARSIIVRPTEILIEGTSIPGYQDLETVPDQQILHLPTLITYSIKSNDQHSMLLRSQQILTQGFAGKDRKTELLAIGAIQFRSKQLLSTDVAPGVVSLELHLEDKELPLEYILVRHGML